MGWWVWGHCGAFGEMRVFRAGMWGVRIVGTPNPVAGGCRGVSRAGRIMNGYIFSSALAIGQRLMS